VSIPTREFSISTKGEVTGEDFRGVFKAKVRLNYSDRLKRDQMIRDLLGGAKLEDAGADGKNIAFVFSKLAVHLVDAPSWWKDARNGLDLEDEAPVTAVYEGILKLEEAAAAELKAKGEEAAKALAEQAKK
jgi:hypothetical protein